MKKIISIFFLVTSITAVADTKRVQFAIGWKDLHNQDYFEGNL